MWITRKDYRELIHARAQAYGEAQALERQTLVFTTTLDWLRVRVNQLERERAALLFNQTGIKFPVPEIVNTSEAKKSLDEAPSFEDPGDEAAAQLGITHALDGTLLYGDGKK
jgi:hypothetical protein